MMNVINYFVAYKPNIYLYPIEKTQLTVKLQFPKGGKVIKSIPDMEKVGMFQLTLKRFNK